MYITSVFDAVYQITVSYLNLYRFMSRYLSSYSSFSVYGQTVTWIQLVSSYFIYWYIYICISTNIKCYKQPLGEQNYCTL